MSLSRTKYDGSKQPLASYKSPLSISLYKIFLTLLGPYHGDIFVTKGVSLVSSFCTFNFQLFEEIMGNFQKITRLRLRRT